MTSFTFNVPVELELTVVPDKGVMLVALVVCISGVFFWKVLAVGQRLARTCACCHSHSPATAKGVYWILDGQHVFTASQEIKTSETKRHGAAPSWTQSYRCLVIKEDIRPEDLRVISGRQQAKSHYVKELTFSQTAEVLLGQIQVCYCLFNLQCCDVADACKGSWVGEMLPCFLFFSSW